MTAAIRSKQIPFLAMIVVVADSLCAGDLGREVSISSHVPDGDEYAMSISDILRHGEELFSANWTWQEGGGRPLTKGTGAPLSDQTRPLIFPRNFNRVSAPDANSCAGCHNSPVTGGNGDIVANVFVLGQRFDFATFDPTNDVVTGEARDESGDLATLNTIANSRATLGMFGSGFIEMLARQITVELQAQRDGLEPGDSVELSAKGIGFGSLSRRADGTWDTSRIEGIAAMSLIADGSETSPSLIIRPFHQAGNVISIRQFSNNAFNHHHGIQSMERFGTDTDPDGDGHQNEMTRGDMTSVSVFQAAMAVPGRVIPRDPEIELAVLNGEAQFLAVGCARCHVPHLGLDQNGWIYTEPNPFNPPNNLQPGDAPLYSVDLTSQELPQPRLNVLEGVVYVSAFTDFKLHDISSGAGDPNNEVLNMNRALGSEEFFQGNRKFLTRKLWGAASKPNFFHHGKFTTMRQAILAHDGEAATERDAFVDMNDYDRNSLIEFLKTLKNLPAGTESLFVDEEFEPRQWPPARFQSVEHISDARFRLQWGGGDALYTEPRLFQLQLKESVDAAGWETVGEPTSTNSMEIEFLGDQGFFRLVPVTE
ncbi:thiol oxidoreductase [Verrucomicrobia bacterium]|jgi:hypothetical protein|nr:thiol oxidoreductase [Verrucomicrobiota bacterium]